MDKLTARTMSDEGATKLLAAIVLTAVQDLHRTCVERNKEKTALWYTDGKYIATDRIAERCISFFHSEWFHTICQLDPDWLIKVAMDPSRSIGKIL